MTTLQDICLLITDGKHGDCQDEDGSGFYFVSCKDVRNGSIDYSGARQITEADYLDTHRRTQFKSNDILITNSGTIGRMALVPDVPETNRTTFQKSATILKPNREKAVPRWLYYSLVANREKLIGWSGGTAQKNLLLRDMRAFTVDVPLLSMQRKIAAILSAYDGLIENNTRRIRILEEMAQAIYREWFVHFRFPGHQKVQLVPSPLGPIPERWTATRLGDLAEEIRRTVQPTEVDPETPYVGLEHIPRKSLALSEWGAASQVQSTKLAFKRGEILFGKIRPYFHRVVVAPVDGVCSSDTIVIRPMMLTSFGLVLTTVSSEPLVSHATQTSQGTKMPRANWDVLVKYPIPTPPESLLAEFNERVTQMVELIQNLVLRIRNLRLTRDLLLPKLISGELDVSGLDINVGDAAA
jgi:type I restriction enzyme, S subunit